MLTVLDAINLSTDFLQKKGIESPRVNAELMLAHILNCKRIDLYLSFDRPLKDDETSGYRELLRKRSNFEPLQYLLGRVEFYGLEFAVNSSVLIPRQETELLVETIIDSADKNIHIDILDIGSGSGNISVALSAHLPNAFVLGIDKSVDALMTAYKNAQANRVGHRTLFIQNDIAAAEAFNDKKFDIIVSNPPYISVSEFETLQPELRIYEPRMALTDEKDGLDFYKMISAKARNMLKPGGKLFFETGKGQSEEVKQILQKNNFKNISIKKDYLNIERVIYGEID
jgi:release factor glutamine methyltransferase